jgi:DNA-directed RNA polymerase subunit RPC12/RpoP
MKIIHLALLMGLILFLFPGGGTGATLTEIPKPTVPTVEKQIAPPPKPAPLPEPEQVSPENIPAKPQETPASSPEIKEEEKGTSPEPAQKTEEAEESPETPVYPFSPFLIQVEGEEPVSLDDFSGAPECGVCHKNIYNQWKGSMHAAAFSDPVWRALMAMGSEETGGKTGKFCIGCHTPAGLVTGDVTKSEDVFSEDTDLVSTFGVQCDVCHVISKDHGSQTPLGEPGNGAFTLSPGKVKRGPYEDCDTAVHTGELSALHMTSLVCANCHQTFHFTSGLPLERTYDEWKHSVYAQKGIQCQHCHMMPVDKAVEAARTLVPPAMNGPASELKSERSPFFSHWFLGGNYPMALREGHQDHAREIMHRLQTAASLDLEVSDAVISPGQLLKLKVKVRNVAAGHNLPTSLVEIRQMWLNIQAQDKDGRTFYHSGSLKESGAIEQNAKLFGAYAVDANGQHTIKPWKIDHFLWNHTIPPKGMEIVDYIIPIPKGITREVRLVVKLRYRPYSQALVNRLLGDRAFEVAVIDMTQKRIVLPVVGK